MKTSLKCVRMGAILSAMLILSSCEKSGPQQQSKPGLNGPPADLVREVKTGTGHVDRMLAAKELEKLPADQLKPFVADLKAALAEEKNAMVKSAIKKTLAKAGG